MNLNTDHLKRCIKTLRSSLTFYEQAAEDSIDQEIFRNAIVKGYELAQETSFKLLKKALRAPGLLRAGPHNSLARTLAQTNSGSVLGDPGRYGIFQQPARMADPLPYSP